MTVGNGGFHALTAKTEGGKAIKKPLGFSALL